MASERVKRLQVASGALQEALQLIQTQRNSSQANSKVLSIVLSIGLVLLDLLSVAVLIHM